MTKISIIYTILKKSK